MRRKYPIVCLLLGLALAALCAARGEVPASAEADLPAGEKYVALTFDDGPNAATTGRLLDGLKERGVRATFFLIGQKIGESPELVVRMAEEGHQIGNHTWSHRKLEGPCAGQVEEEVSRTEEALRDLLGEGEFWLRPPYGYVSEGAEKSFDVPLVRWSVDPRDWESRNAEQSAQAILRDVKPNSIILLHDIYPTSVEAALRVVDRLQEEGYWFVTVEELLRLNGIDAEPGSIYREG